MKKVLFIDRDGTLIREPPVSLQVDSLEQLEFVPGVFRYLSLIAETTDYELVMVSNQDGLGTSSFPEEQFWPAHHKMIRALANEGIHFAEEHIDRSLPGDNSPDRKPGIGMLHQYFCNEYDLANSFVIGDRATDMELAQNLGARGILFSDGAMAVTGQHMPALQTTSWKDIYTYLRFGLRKASISRKTKETDVRIQLNLDGSGLSTISTGVAFFDHMLEQISKHGMIDLDIQVAGDLQVDEHHTIEDTAIVLGQAFRAALGDKAGLNRYGFCLPMDDCLAQVALDFGGRSWLEWDATFCREMIGKMPTEMFLHFFKSFSDAAACNLNIKAEGQNEHHKIEAIFKAFAKALRMAIARDLNNMVLPTTKGTLS